MFSNSSTVILLYRNAICLIWTSSFWISYTLLFISKYFICLPYHVFFTLKCCSTSLLQHHLSSPIIHAYVVFMVFCTYSSYHTILHSSSVFFAVLSCRIPSSYTILPPSRLHIAEMDKKDVSRTKIRLDPSIFSDGGNTCQYVMPFYYSVPIPSLCCRMFYN